MRRHSVRLRPTGAQALTGMSVDMALQPVPWLLLLVITAMAMLGRSVPVVDGNGLYKLLGGLSAGDGIHYDSAYPPVVPGNATLPAGQTAGTLWSRLHDGFALPADRPAAVQTWIDRFASDPGNIERILQRGRPYLYHIIGELQQRGLPMELALLPAIESAFVPSATSPRHAAGLWQFMPATARGMGLRQDAWYDGRRDVIASTSAALDYLTQLQKRFDGDWLLALAAYNAGGARVQRAIRQNRNDGRPVDFWHLPLPKETRDYVPKLLALCVLIRKPQDYGLHLPVVVNTPYFTTVETGGQLDLAVAARLAGISADEMRRLNPAYIRQTVHRDGPGTLLAPRRHAEILRTRLAGLAEEKRTQWVRYRIRTGDTLSTIARRYRTTLAQLRAFNHLPNSRIMAGDLLIVPVARS